VLGINIWLRMQRFSRSPKKCLRNSFGILAVFCLCGVATGQVKSLKWTLAEIDQAALQGNYDRIVELVDESEGAFKRILLSQSDLQFEHSIRGSQKPPPDPTHFFRIATIAYAFTGNIDEARKLSDLRLDRMARLRRIADLRTQLLVHPGDEGVTALLAVAEDLSQSLGQEFGKEKQPLRDEDPISESLGKTIYSKHCKNCHGGAGDGKGWAARHLFPRPRAISTEPLRYVSAANSMATDSDLLHVIKNGLVGSSMPAFPRLESDELNALIRYLRFLQYEGLVATFLRQQREDVEYSRDQLVVLAKAKSSPSEEITLPPWTLNETATIDLDRGERTFRSAGCAACHEESGGSIAKFNSQGFLDYPRDFKNEPLRRGHSLSGLYKTIRLGLPGTAHPAVDLADEKIEEISRYLYAITIREPKITSNAARRHFFTAPQVD
jgi:mono/diheme cytochrome c family protein